MIFPFLAALATAAPGDDAAAIKALRRQYNAAIAAHDMDAIRPFLMPDYVVLPGSLGKPLDADALGRRLFADPTLITYVRTPRRVAISGARKRAAETGTWVGTWRKSDGEMRLTGIYQAMWVPHEGSWRLRNESFVSLACSGSRACAEVD